MPKISVIVPIYKVEKYLSRCIDSILAQTFIDFELLLIDDGSPDKCGVICDVYAAKDSRIKVFHKENGGVSSARNLGLDNMSGDWVCFVDPDDYIDDDFLDVIYKTQIEDENYIVICGYVRESINDANILSCNRFSSKKYLFNSSESIEKPVMFQIIKYGTVWGKVYSSKIVNRYKMKFDDQLDYHEDHLFYLQYLTHGDKVRTIDYCGYHYVLDPANESLSSKQTYDPKALLYAYKTCKYEIGIIVSKWGLNTELANTAYSAVYSFLIHTIIMAYVRNEPRGQRLEYIRLCTYKEIKQYDAPGSIFKMCLMYLPAIVCDCLLKIKYQYYLKV